MELLLLMIFEMWEQLKEAQETNKKAFNLNASPQVLLTAITFVYTLSFLTVLLDQINYNSQGV